MRQRLDNVKSAGCLIAIVCFAVTSCSTHREVSNVHWQTASNLCFATFQHVWSDVTFQTDPSVAVVEILRPVAAMAAREDRPELIPKAQASQQRERAAVPAAVTTQAVARVESAVQRPSIQTEKQIGAIQGSASPAKQEASERKAVATASEKAGTAREKEAVPSSTTSDARPAEVAKDTSGSQRSGNATASIGTAANATSSREAAQAGSARSDQHAPTQVAAAKEASSRELASNSDLRAKGDTSSTIANNFAGRVDVRNINAQALNKEFAGRVETEAVLPLLDVQKSCESASVLAGKTVRFRIQVKNTGTLELRNITLHDTASGVLQFVGLGEVTGGKVSRAASDQFRIGGTLKPEANISFVTTYRVPRPEP